MCIRDSFFSQELFATHAPCSYLHCFFFVHRFSFLNLLQSVAAARRRLFSSSNATFSEAAASGRAAELSRPSSTDATSFIATARAASVAAGWRCLKTSTTASKVSAFVFSLTTPAAAAKVTIDG